jgi:AcrR family transcriptional regulator
MDQESVRKDLLKTARSLLFRDGSNFTLASLCKESGLSRTELRRIFPTKSALIAALDQEIITETLAKFSEAKLHEETLQEVSQNEPAAPQPDNGWVDRRLRVLERAIELLETRIETVSVEQSRLPSLMRN